MCRTTKNGKNDEKRKRVEKNIMAKLEGAHVIIDMVAYNVLKLLIIKYIVINKTSVIFPFSMKVANKSETNFIFFFLSLF